MVHEILIILSFLIVLSYIIEIASKRIKVPSVIFLIAIGISIRLILDSLKISIPDTTLFLKIFGGISLLLVVLQGSMELKWSRDKNKTIIKMFLMCVLPMLTFSFLVSWFFHVKSGVSFYSALVNIIPFSVISSSIAIPATSLIGQRCSEEIVYESSYSDIFGILFFDFIFQQKGNILKQTEFFFGELAGMLLFTILATIFIAWLLGILKTKVKLIPIMAGLMFVYEIAEYFNLPGLIFIFVFGLFLGNLQKLSDIKYISRIKPKKISENSEEFYMIVTEIAFLTRSMFFLILGYYINVLELLNIKALLVSVSFIVFIYLIRLAYLLLLKVEVLPNLFYAPRGLVTILLFLYIPSTALIPGISVSVVIQVVIISILIMSLGPWFSARKGVKDNKEQ